MKPRTKRDAVALRARSPVTDISTPHGRMPIALKCGRTNGSVGWRKLGHELVTAAVSCSGAPESGQARAPQRARVEPGGYATATLRVNPGISSGVHWAWGINT